MSPSVVFCWIVRATLLFGCGVGAADTCYPTGGVAGIVVATAIVTCVVGGLTAATAWKFWWTPRRKKAQQESQTSQQHRHQPQKSSADFAFDNPYFRNQEGEDAGKYKSSLNKNSLRSSKQSESSAKGKKGRGGRNHFVFGGGKKQKALDDTCLAAVERTFVNLRGHDFTGLGFNICGNMRDGILVKDVLHRGPASESGLIKAGDKIVNVTVSFTNIVYEDALTILSYASPYDVQLEIERTPDDASKTSPTASRKLGSRSFSSSGQKLFHPLYRSQSIDDLTQIDREGGPRRSQSVGVAAHKLAAHFRGPEDRSLALSATGSLNEKMLATVMAEPNKGPLQWEKRFEDSLDGDPEKADPRPKDPRQYLDFPPARRTLETRMVMDESDINAALPPPQKEEVATPRQRTASRLSRRVDEDNDSDVSKDSLEVTQRARKKSASSEEKQTPDSSSPAVLPPSRRPYGQQPPRLHTNEEQSTDSSNKPSAVYRKCPYGGDRPKVTPVETHAYGNRVVANGDTKSHPQHGATATDTSHHHHHKFSKKPLNPAGGMFTQINPFQMPSKQKHPGFKPRESNGDFQTRQGTHLPSSVLKQSRTDYVQH